MSGKIIYLLCLISIPLIGWSQTFEMIPINQMMKSSTPILFRRILPTTKGTVLMATTLSNLAEVEKMQFSVTWSNGYPLDSKGNKVISAGRSDVFKDIFELATGIKLVAEGPGKIIYYVTDNNHIGYINYRYGKNAFGFPPFIFPESREQPVDIKNIWLDTRGNLFIATNYDTLYVVDDAANINVMDNDKWLRATYKTGFDADSNIIITEGARRIKKYHLGKGVIPVSFSQNRDEEDQILIGTNKGLYLYEHSTATSINLIPPGKDQNLTITHIFSGNTSAFIWLSTLEKGMGRYTHAFNNPLHWYPYRYAKDSLNPIRTFCRKSQSEFFVAPIDSIPAVFNTETGKYYFISDTAFRETKKACTDIKLDASGVVYLIMDGTLFTAKNIDSDALFSEVEVDSTVSQVLIIDVKAGGKSLSEFPFYEINNVISLKYYENDISILYAARGFKSNDSLEFAWKLDGLDSNWSVMPYSMLDENLNGATFPALEPGEYTFYCKVRKSGGQWREPAAKLRIIIKPAFWRTWWFWLSMVGGILTLIYVTAHYRAKAVRRKERIRLSHEKEVLELEARALRAQMNPHFIFNCLNSIKSLMQENQIDKGVSYLTTFSKLIRTLFNNADKKEISLYDEIETCKLYLQLEAMRFDAKFSYHINIDETIDLKSISVPALIIQPFIENAIWHGIVPKERDGNVSLNVSRTNGNIEIVVDDNGIGRESSQQNKSTTTIGHQSKGVNLTQSRLELDNLLQQRQAKLEIIDKKDENGKTSGTRVIITLPQED